MSDAASALLAPQDPPGFVVATELGKAADDNGFRLVRASQGAWLHRASTTAPAAVWLAGAGDKGPWFLALARADIAAEISAPSASIPSAPAAHAFACPSLIALHHALGRVYRLAVSLPAAPLDAFVAKTQTMPRTTEAERLAVQRVGQDIFRDALLAYWNHRCPLTGITDAALLRASHIVRWADCETDAQRLDVHNGLLLSALWDAAFDTGLVGFDDDGSVIASSRLTIAAIDALGLGRDLALGSLTDVHRTNLKRHRVKHGLMLARTSPDR